MNLPFGNPSESLSVNGAGDAGRLYRAVEQSAALVLLVDAEGDIAYANPRFLSATGYRPAEIIGHEPFFWRAAEDGPDAGSVRTAAMAGQDWQGEFTIVRSDGSPLAVSATVSPVTAESGAIAHMLVVAEDVSRRKAVEGERRSAEQMDAASKLTGGIAHDFNNLLAIIIGNLDLLSGELAGDTEKSASVEVALAAALRGAELTRQLLAFARQQPLAKETFDVNGRLSTSLAALRSLLGEGVELRTDLARNAWPVDADPAQLETALRNLLVNSRDAMPQGGTITVATANRRFDAGSLTPDATVAPGDYVAISVTDTGTGISGENLKRVVEPFFTTKGAGKGPGLGLSMVYGFARQSGGHLRVDSVLGSGTIITLFLPRSKAMEAPIWVEPEAKIAPARDAAILVVEDNPDVRDVVVRQLVGLGYRVESVEDAVTALRAIRNAMAVDLVFSDMVLPNGLSGAALAREVRRIRPEVKVLLTSGAVDAAFLGEALEDNVPLIRKPYRRAELARKVQEVLGDAA